MKNQFELNCPIHGAQLKRADCRRCNALYMSAYMRQRRRRDPVAALLERARERAARLDLPFNLRRRDVVVPPVCPVLGVPLAAGSERSSGSPSLDRIRPALGYVRGNVRVSATGPIASRAPVRRSRPGSALSRRSRRVDLTWKRSRPISNGRSFWRRCAGRPRKAVVQAPNGRRWRSFWTRRSSLLTGCGKIRRRNVLPSADYFLTKTTR